MLITPSGEMQTTHCTHLLSTLRQAHWAIEWVSMTVKRGVRRLLGGALRGPDALQHYEPARCPLLRSLDCFSSLSWIDVLAVRMLFLIHTPGSGLCCIENVYFYNFPGDSDGKASAYNAGDPGSIPGSGRSPGEGNGTPLQYSCLENPMDRGAW